MSEEAGEPEQCRLRLQVSPRSPDFHRAGGSTHMLSLLPPSAVVLFTHRGLLRPSQVSPTAPQDPNLVPWNWVFSGIPSTPSAILNTAVCPLARCGVPALQPGSATSVHLWFVRLPPGASPVETGHSQSLLGVLSPRISAFQPHHPLFSEPHPSH